MGKVYCENCKYISSMGWFCKKEFKFKLEDNYFHKQKVKYYECAETKNKGNNCSDFISKNNLTQIYDKIRGILYGDV